MNMNQHHHHLFTQLEALKRASTDLQNNTIFTSNDSHHATIKPLLDLEFKPDSLFSTDPFFSNLNQLLCNLKTLLAKLENCQGFSLKCLLDRHIIRYKISHLGYAIEKEIQGYIDRENVHKLVKKLDKSNNDDDEEEKIEVLIEFIDRVSHGFDGDFQELILKAKVFSIFELLVCDTNRSKKFREYVSLAIEALVRFNRNVFLGLMMMGPTIQALISMKSSCSIQVLCSLIKLIRSPLIDEIHSNNKIPEIIALLSSNELSIQMAAMDCICQIAYLGRREVIEAMIEEELIINKLMELQRSQSEDNLGLVNTSQSSDCDSVLLLLMCEDNVVEGDGNDDNSPFSKCVTRFAVQVEVGEGLCLKEKMEIKLEILKRIKEASVSEAEAATIVAEVLWGSSP